MTEALRSDRPYNSAPTLNSEGPIDTTVAKVNEISERYFIEGGQYDQLQCLSERLRAAGGFFFMGTFYSAIYLLIPDKPDATTAISIMVMLVNGIFFMALGAGYAIALAHAKKLTHDRESIRI